MANADNCPISSFCWWNAKMHFLKFFHAFDICLEKNEKWHGRSEENYVISWKKRKEVLQKKMLYSNLFLR